MRTLVAVLLAGLLVLLVVMQWSSRYRATAVSQASQIYIHDTPVCVRLEGEQLVARVGKCPRDNGVFEEPGPGRLPFHGAPGRGLPPGHPPIGPQGPLDENRRLLI